MSEGNRDGAATGEAFKVHSRAVMRSRGRGPQRNGKVSITRLSPLAEETALFLADGNRARFRILSCTVVIVENRPRGQGRRS